ISPNQSDVVPQAPLVHLFPTHLQHLVAEIQADNFTGSGLFRQGDGPITGAATYIDGGIPGTDLHPLHGEAAPPFMAAETQNGIHSVIIFGNALKHPVNKLFLGRGRRFLVHTVPHPSRANGSVKYGLKCSLTTRSSSRRTSGWAIASAFCLTFDAIVCMRSNRISSDRKAGAPGCSSPSRASHSSAAKSGAKSRQGFSQASPRWNKSERA